jgi:hypothetical protein
MTEKEGMAQMSEQQRAAWQMDWTDLNEVRKAIILSEILNRKY